MTEGATERIDRSHTKSQGSTKCREHEALGQDLHDDTAASRAERGSERQLTRAPVRACQQEVGDVRTAHEEHEADHAEQQIRRQAHFSTDEARAQRIDRDATIGVGRGKLRGQALGHRRHVASRGIDGDTRLQASDHPHEVNPSGVHARQLDEDRPDAGRTQYLSLLRHDAEHGERIAVDPDRAPDQRGIAAESRAPVPLTQHDDVWWQCLVSRQKGPPRDRLDAEHVEELRGDLLGQDLLGGPVRGGYPAGVGERGSHRLEGPVPIAPVAEVEGRHAGPKKRSKPLGDHHQAIGLGERKWTEQGRVGEGEHRAVGADAERQRDGGHQREAGRPSQLPQRERHVVSQLFDPSSHPHLALSLSSQVYTCPFELAEIADTRQHGLASRFRIHPALDQLAGPHLDVQGELVVYFLIERHTPEPRTQ